MEHRRVDVLFANAGGARFTPLGEITEDHFDEEFNTNFKGLLLAVQKALPLLTDGASIILTASMVSINSMPAISAYSSTKSPVRSFARTFTVDVKGRGIGDEYPQPRTD